MYYYGFYLFSALAFLTKGLIGIVFPFGIALVYMIATHGWKGFKKVLSLKGIILFMLISLPWLIAQVSINGQEFVDQFFIKHHSSSRYSQYMERKGQFPDLCLDMVRTYFRILLFFNHKTP